MHAWRKNKGDESMLKKKVREEDLLIRRKLVVNSSRVLGKDRAARNFHGREEERRESHQ